MQAQVGVLEGQRLDRLIRRGTNPITVRRAEIILESALGASVEDLAERYALPSSYVESLISGFNRCGMAAITAGSRGKRKVMLPEEVSILHEIVRVPPKAVGLDATAWTVELLQQTGLARRWVDVADPAVWETLIAGRQRGVSSKPNCQTSDLPNRDRH